MSAYRMVDVGFSYYHVTRERRQVGRVWRGSDGMWRATIDREEGPSCPTAREAFDEGAARALGYSSALALRQRNAAVRARQRAALARGMDVVRRYYAASTPEGRMAALDSAKTLPELTDTLRAFTHSLKRRSRRR